MDEINAFFDFSKDFHRESVPRGCVSGNLWALAGKPTDGKPTKRECIGDGYAREVKAQERSRMMDIDVAEDVADAHSSRYSSGVVGNAPSLMNDLEDFSENENDEEELDVKPKINRIDDGVYDKFVFNLQRDETLPIHDTKDDIISQIRKSPVVILEGDTGCGKTTQIIDATVESTSLWEDSVTLDLVTNMAGASSSSTSKHIPKRMTLLDGIFFKYVPENSTSNKVAATCVKCLPRTVEVKGYNNCTSNFISHLKRKHGDVAVKEYKCYLQQIKKGRKDKLKPIKTSMSASKSSYNNDDVTEANPHDYSRYSNRLQQNLKAASIEKTANMMSSMSESESCNSNVITQSTRSSQIQENFDEDIVKFFIHSMVPLRVVENPYFFNMFKNINSTVKVMSHQSLEQKINDIYMPEMYRVREVLRNPKYICTTTEILSECKKSLLGVTAHWIDEQHLQRLSVGMACVRFKGTHSNTEHITKLLSNIYNDFDIKSHKILATLTIRSNNYKKAFQAFGVDPEVVEMNHNDDDDIFENIGLSSTEADTNTDLENETDGICTNYARKSDHTVRFSLFEPLNFQNNEGISFNLSCNAFKLTLCALDVTKQVLESNDYIAVMHKSVLTKCNALWNMSRHPETAGIIQHILGLKLQLPLASRWNSLYHALKQMTDIKEKYGILHHSLSLEHPMSECDFDYITEYVISAEPVAEALNILQERNDCFYGIVMPCFLALRRRLKKLQKIKFVYCTELAAAYLQSVEERFKHFFELSTVEAENAAVAALTYPRFKNKWFTCLNTEPLGKIENIFKTVLAKEIASSPHFQEKYANVQKRYKEDKEFFVFTSDSEEETPPKENVSPSKSSAELLIRRFFGEDSEDLQLLHRYPEIRNVFIKYNTPFPAVSPTGTFFSSVTMSHLPKRNKQSNHMFEKCLILRTNLKCQTGITSN